MNHLVHLYFFSIWKIYFKKKNSGLHMVSIMIFALFIYVNQILMLEQIIY